MKTQTIEKNRKPLTLTFSIQVSDNKRKGAKKLRDFQFMLMTRCLQFSYIFLTLSNAFERWKWNGTRHLYRKSFMIVDIGIHGSKTYFLFRTNHESRFVCESMKGKKSSLWKILSFLTHTYIHWWALLKTDCCLFKDLSIICKSLQQYFCSHETSILSPVCIFIMIEFTFIYTFFCLQ